MRAMRRKDLERIGHETVEVLWGNFLEGMSKTKWKLGITTVPSGYKFRGLPLDQFDPADKLRCSNLYNSSVLSQ
jgi:hypothetical protein